jgi:hypothetical protein
VLWRFYANHGELRRALPLNNLIAYRGIKALFLRKRLMMALHKDIFPAMLLSCLVSLALPAMRQKSTEPETGFWVSDGYGLLVEVSAGGLQAFEPKTNPSNALLGHYPFFNTHRPLHSKPLWQCCGGCYDNDSQ